jgi:hypothetical protein
MDPRRGLELRNAYQRGVVAPRGGTHVLVAAMPKSGSSLLIRMVEELHGFERIAVVRGHDRRENELALDLLVRAHDRDWVAQAHVRHSATTARMLQTFSLRTVFQFRDLPDVFVSLHDHLLGIATVNPIAYVPDVFADWPRERRLEFVVDAFAPWYLHFFLSWIDVPDTLWVRYGDLIGDPLRELRRVAEFVGVSVAPDELSKACERALQAPIPTRNRVVEGRGRDLPPTARRQLERLAGYYSGFDLSPIGL